MERFQHVLLNVWQEACRHIDISQSTATIAPMLVRHLPIEQVLVRRIDTARSCLETVAVGLAGRKHRLPDARTDCTAAELESLLAWCRRQRVAHRQGNEAAMADLAAIVFGRLDGDALAGPLGDPAGHCGMLVFLAPAGPRLYPRTRRVGPTAAGAVLRGVGK